MALKKDKLLTRTSYLSSLQELDNQIQAIQAQKKQLKEQWKSQCLIQEGDKVKLTLGNFNLSKSVPDTEIELYVGSIHFGLDDSYDDLQFTFLLPKKDGSKSKKIYHLTIPLIKNIEKIK